MNDNAKVLAALLSGVAAGLAIGLLLAPEKGSDMREKIIAGTKDLADGIRDKAQSGMDSFSSIRETITEKTNSLTDKFKDGVTNMSDKADDYERKMRNA